jgi:ATP-dependent Clp protease ATP-binding subunit ClpC
VRRHPYSVILFDEIEKAHPDIFNAMLQVLDDGRLTDAKGRVINFSNTVIIMTSNIGSDVITRMQALGFREEQRKDVINEDEMQHRVMDLLRERFRPEFLNRVDEIIIFHPLTRIDIEKIIDLQIENVNQRLLKKGIQIELTSKAKEHLLAQGFDPMFGARPMKRAIQTHILDQLAMEIIEGNIKTGNVKVDLDKGKIVFK